MKTIKIKIPTKWNEITSFFKNFVIKRVNHNQTVINDLTKSIIEEIDKIVNREPIPEQNKAYILKALNETIRYLIYKSSTKLK